MPTNYLADMFRMAESRKCTISLSFDWQSFKIEARRGELSNSRYFNPRDLNDGDFILRLASRAITELDYKEKQLKEKEKKDD